MVPTSPLPHGCSITTRSRLARTILPSATMSLPRIASRITANASWPTGSFGTRKYIEEPLIHLVARHKAVDLDCVIALDRHRIEFVLLNKEILVFANFVAARLLAWR